MFVVATAPASAVVFLFVLSFFCFMSGAALRRWPDRVQAYIERVDGSLWFVTPETHRARPPRRPPPDPQYPGGELGTVARAKPR